MEYTEIFNRIYANDDDKNKLYVVTLSSFDKETWKIIKFLRSRAGFDYWWDGIDKDIQDEIFSELRRIVFMAR